MPTAPQPARTRKPTWPEHARPAPVEYPDSDGEPMAETIHHADAIFDTIFALRGRYPRRDQVAVSGNVLMYYVEGDPRKCVSPDVFVTFDLLREPSPGVWKTWEEGKFADFVLEVTSETTRARDEDEKRRLYQRLGVTEYWQFDPTADYLDPPLKGHRLNLHGTYERVPLATSRDGMIHGESKLLGLHLCLYDNRLRLKDPASGRFLPTHHAENRHADDSEGTVEGKDRIVEETSRLLAEERRLHAKETRALQAEIERLRRNLAS